MPVAAKKVRVAVVGASGYSGEELVRLLLAHPHVELCALTSRQYAGKPLSQVLPWFAGHPAAKSLRFTDSTPEHLMASASVVFLALPHGVAAEFARPLLDGGCKVIDLSADFRLRSADVYQQFYGQAHPAPDLLAEAVYGLPEVHAAAIRNARLVASPGCYPTSVLLPLLPLLREGLVKPTGIIATSLSGVSGAGRKAELPYLFVECNESARPYSVPRHRHLSEMEQELSAAAGLPVLMQFTPHLIPMSRGILTTLHLAPAQHFNTELEMAELAARITRCYHNAYEHAPFVRLLCGDALPDTKQVARTNFLDLAWRLDPRTGRLLVMSAIDNIVKGAGGQAVQSLNLICGFEETAGLL